MAWQNRTLVRRPDEVRRSTLLARRSTLGWCRDLPPALPPCHVILTKFFLGTPDVCLDDDSCPGPSVCVQGYANPDLGLVSYDSLFTALYVTHKMITANGFDNFWRLMQSASFLLLLMSCGMKLSKNPQVTEGFAKFGFPPGLEVSIGVVELICTVLYVIPRTAAVGAILLTGYLGGAVVVHVKGGEPWFAPVIIGVVLWTGLVLRNPRLRSVLPWWSNR